LLSRKGAILISPDNICFG